MTKFKPKKLYTLEEASKTLKEVIPSLKRIKRMAETITLIGSVKSDNALVGTYKMQKELHKLHYDFFNHLDFLDEQGIIVRDPHIGSIEFPAKNGEEEIVFKFQLGQEKIESWSPMQEDESNSLMLL